MYKKEIKDKLKRKYEEDQNEMSMKEEDQNEMSMNKDDYSDITMNEEDDCNEDDSKNESVDNTIDIGNYCQKKEKIVKILNEIKDKINKNKNRNENFMNEIVKEYGLIKYLLVCVNLDLNRDIKVMLKFNREEIESKYMGIILILIYCDKENFLKYFDRLRPNNLKKDNYYEKLIMISAYYGSLKCLNYLLIFKKRMNMKIYCLNEPHNYLIIENEDQCQKNNKEDVCEENNLIIKILLIAANNGMHEILKKYIVEVDEIKKKEILKKNGGEIYTFKSEFEHFSGELINNIILKKNRYLDKMNEIKNLNKIIEILKLTELTMFEERSSYKECLEIYNQKFKMKPLYILYMLLLQNNGDQECLDFINEQIKITKDSKIIEKYELILNRHLNKQKMNECFSKIKEEDLDKYYENISKLEEIQEKFKM